MLGAELHLLETPQATQARVEDVVGLNLGQFEPGLQLLLWLVLLADDADHLVEIEVGDDHAGQHFEPMLDGGATVARLADQHRAAMVDPLLQRFGQADDPRHHAVDQHVHVERDARLEFAHAEQAFHHHGRRDGSRARLDDDAHLLGRFVPQVSRQAAASCR